MEGETSEDPTLFPATLGEKLRGAREAQGLELAEIAARTRIPQRHLEAIEKSNYDGLPSITYAIGFSKSYARAVGMDEVEVARELRGELGRNPERIAPAPSYDVEDATRLPPRGLALAMVALVVLAMIGFGLWYGTGLFRGSAPPPETLVIPEGNSSDAANASAPAITAAAGQVTLVALDLVWVRVTDAKGQTLFEKEMIPGERYDVPAEADHPRIRTPGPEKLQVLLNGSDVPGLGAAGQTVDVEVGAQAIQARGQPGASPTPESRSPSTRPAPRSSRASAPVARPTLPLFDPAPGNTSPAP